MESVAERTIRRTLLYSLYAVVELHILQLALPFPHTVEVSRLLTGAVPLLAALCALWRASRLTPRERPAWRWLSVTMMLLAAGQVVEVMVGHSSAAVNLSVDASDFLYITAALPLLLAVSRTRHTESIRTVFVLDIAQVALASFLAFVLLYRMAVPAEKAATAMSRIFLAECVLLALFAVLRLVTWSTLEERRRVRLLFAVVWIYLPIEVGMEYAATHWNLRAGTLPDILWSVPFLFAGRQALSLPMDEKRADRRERQSRLKLLVESLFPMLITAGVFALVASIASQHLALALSASFLLLVIQSLHAGLVHLSYLNGQNLLIERELELEKANSALERLSMEDPLTGVANRRRFDAVLEEVWRRASRRRDPLSLLMIDLDFFKAVNDRQGHAYGDECLINVARVLAGAVGRPDDLLARYGGEEFVVLLPETDLAGATAVAERLRHAVYSQKIPNDGSHFERRLTISVGIGTCEPAAGIEPATLVQVADLGLYEAKRTGRNRVCMRTLESVSERSSETMD